MTSVVTGGFGFSGQEIAKQLLARGEQPITLTNHPQPRSPFFNRIAVRPLNFDNPDELVASMKGATVLYNTYWIRFAHGPTNHQYAVRNTGTLLAAARKAGVQRIVHVSITNPSLDSSLPYFRGKAEVEQLIRSSGMSYAILRPAVLFGSRDILINNIAFLLRRSPVFAIPGNGRYRIQPIFVEDLADLAVQSASRSDNFVIDAIGPETFSYLDLVNTIRAAVGSKARIVHVPPVALRSASWVLGKLLHDVILTTDEIKGLMADLLVSQSQPTGHTSLRGWLSAHDKEVGRTYASELSRHYV